MKKTKPASHKAAIEESVKTLEEIVDKLEKQLERHVSDLKVMRLMLAQCKT